MAQMFAPLVNTDADEGDGSERRDGLQRASERGSSTPPLW